MPTKATRQAVLDEFLQIKFGKEHQLTKQDLLSISGNDLRKKFTSKTSRGSTVSLYNWYSNSENRDEKNVFFYLLEDLGYAKTYSITEAEAKQSGRDKISQAHDIFSSKENRQLTFHEFLQNKFGKEHQITKEDLLSLEQKAFRDKSIRQTSIGSAASLYNWYSNSENRDEKNTIFYLLEDLGYAKTYSITENDVKFRKKIVFIEDKLILSEPKPQEELTEPLCRHDTQYVVQVVISTVKNGNSHPEPTQSLCERALQHYFQDILAVSDKKAYEVLPAAKEGATFVIHSSYPLDEVYQRGLALLGYDIKSQNLTNSQLNGLYFSVVERATVQNNAVGLMFRNDLNPYKNSLHILGQYSRMANDAQSQAELFNAIGLALDWIVQMKKEKVLPQDQMGYVESRGLAKLISVEKRAMWRLGMDNRYDAQELSRDHSSALLSLKQAQASVSSRQSLATNRSKLSAA